MPFGGLLTLGIIGGVTSVYAAKKQSDASKEAAKQQSDSGKEALALQEKMWQQGQQNLQPWMQTGGWAATTLGGLMGMPDAKAAPNVGTDPSMLSYTSMKQPQPSPPQKTVNALESPYDPYYWKTHPVLDGESRFQARRSTLGEAMTPQQAQRQSGYTRMRAPDGEEQDIPSEQVPHFTSLGATVV